MNKIKTAGQLFYVGIVGVLLTLIVNVLITTNIWPTETITMGDTTQIHTVGSDYVFALGQFISIVPLMYYLIVSPKSMPLRKETIYYVLATIIYALYITIVADISNFIYVLDVIVGAASFLLFWKLKNYVKSFPIFYICCIYEILYSFNSLFGLIFSMFTDDSSVIISSLRYLNWICIVIIYICIASCLTSKKHLS